MSPAKVLLLVASPRGAASSSLRLGEHLLARLEERGMALKTLALYPALADERKMAELLAAVDMCTLLLLAFPLYVDQLPAPLVGLLQQVAERRLERSGGGRQTLAAIVQCGFPETGHCRPAGEIVRLFAAQAGFRFLGCLACGMGGAFGRGRLAERGWIVRHQVAALDAAAACLAEGREIPPEVIARMGRPMMPLWLYKMAAHRGWKRLAGKTGRRDSLGAAPFAGQGDR